MSKRSLLLGALALAIAALVTYQPGLKIGFLDGWWYLQWVGTMDLPRYAIQFLDPRNVTQGYRPVQGLYVLVQYLLFGFNPDGYHLAHTLLHAANGVLLFLVVGRLGRHWRVAFMAALFYVVSPVLSLAIFWHAVVDPLSAFFYLLTLLLWIRYQETRRARDWLATFAAFVFALFAKEIAVFLPVLLFLIERWFFGRKDSLAALIRRYAPFVAWFIPFGLLELNVQSHGEFAGQFGFKIGPHMLANLMPYLAVLAWPWTADFPTDAVYYVWMALAVLVYLAVMVYKRSKLLLFLLIFAVLNIAPLLGFPLDYFNTRYLYTSLMVSAILMAVLVEAAWQILKTRGPAWAVAPLLVVIVMLASGLRVADAASGLAEFTRQLRVPFRDISRQHSSFPDNSYLYFVYSPKTPLVDLQGLFFVRYGKGLRVEGTDDGSLADLQGHPAAYLYYFDSSDRPVELPVEKIPATRASPALPVQFAGPIRLERIQSPGVSVQRGKALIALLDWSTESTPGANYTVFAHLLDPAGNLIASYDSPPRRNQAPTSTWKRGPVYVDAVVLPIDPRAPGGDNFRLEIGMYNPATMERLAVVDANGRRLGDAVTFGPFSIVGPE